MNDYTGIKGIEGERFVLEQGSEGFPSALLDVDPAPTRLYVIGEPAALKEGLAVIGSRKATPYGMSCAARFAKHAAEQGVCVVSGGARGCDTSAVDAALEAGCAPVVILAGGLDNPYPAQNVPQLQRVVDAGGAVVSEQPWDAPPVPWMFRHRNRLIAGLAKATLVVEAGLPSGTFATVDQALAAGREVLAVPGPITSPQSRGTNRLIWQGATPVVDDETFLDALYTLYGEEIC